ncbi:MAG TPA: TonB family protein [Thermodesulfovibrionales bacterium]|nr:TonB family protein [Thermodesulfovibrionales bacterium]
MLHALTVAAAFIAGSSSDLRKIPVVAVSLINAWNTEPDGGQKEATAQKQPKKSMPAREALQRTRAAEDSSRNNPRRPEEQIAGEASGAAIPQHDNTSPAPIGASRYGDGDAAGNSATPAGSGTAYLSTGRVEGTAAMASGVTGTGQQGSSGEASLRQKIRAALQANLVYPYIARKRQMEGSVMVSFRINQTGNPESIRILKGSGYSILDSAARDTVVKASPFPTANNFVEVPITFTLRDH